MGLADASLTVSPGEVVALLGPNGSGKTTLLRVLATELSATSGAAWLFGGPAGARSLLREQRRAIGYAPDEAAHLEVLSGLENAALFGRLAGLRADPARQAATELFDLWGLAADAESPVSGWSFGMRRKLVLTEALLHRPRLILLDEPTVGLDPPSLAVLRRLLRERLEGGAGAVVATNDVQEAERIATRVVFLHRGESVLEGTPRGLLDELAAAARIEVEVGGGGSPAALDLPGALTVEVTPHRVVATVQDSARALPRILEGILEAGLTVRAARVREPHLGDVFLRAVGAELDPDGDREP